MADCPHHHLDMRDGTDGSCKRRRTYLEFGVGIGFAWAACGAGHLVEFVQALVSKLYMIVPLVLDIICQGRDDATQQKRSAFK